VHLRYARHTTDLEKITRFYTDIVGLQVLGRFSEHEGYNGVFLGFPGQSWHLEFTTSEKKPAQLFDEDDALVLYVHAEIELDAIKAQLQQQQVPIRKPLNPYWQKHGMMISDPDGYHVIFAFKDIVFAERNEPSPLFGQYEITSWNGLLEYVKQLPYGRNQNRNNCFLVLTEQKGTCSSKHALVKKIADQYGIGQVKLVMGIYKMNHQNTPKIGSLLTDRRLEYIPEAHCYLKIHDRRVDLTSPESDIDNLVKDLMEEVEIEPEQVSEFKVRYHQDFVKRWMKEYKIKMEFDEVWSTRELCIQNLSQ
jgi:catechol 2,3-dioxygenase-like lactoylglutathione lyase family enzyme